MGYIGITVLLGVIFQCLRPISTDHLLAVAAIINHGDTIPSKFYPTDPYQSPKYWDKQLGQLSILGEQQSFAVGKWLRRRYDTKIPFISLHYNGSQSYAFSEDRDESLMSAECIMAGLYPPVGDEVWRKGINWRPTPVHSEPLFLDWGVGRGAYCPKYNQELEKVKHGRFMRVHNQNEKALLSYLSEKTGETFSHIGQIPELFNLLTVEREHNLTLPEWTHAVFPGALAQVVLEMSIMRTKNPELTRFSIGPLLNKIQSQFQAVVTHNPDLGKVGKDLRKFKLYVANDTLIYDAIRGLKAPSVGVVPFGATLILEMWGTDTGVKYVKLLYKGSPELNTPIQQLAMGGCKSIKCPYSIFNNTLTDFGTNYTQWNSMCNNVAQSSLFDPHNVPLKKPGPF